MIEAVVSGCIALLGSIITVCGVVYTTKKNHDKTIFETQKQLELVTQKYELTTSEIKRDIRELNDDVKKYNNLKDRMFAAESAIKVLEARTNA